MPTPADQYEIVFDLAKSGYSWHFPATGLLFTALGFLLVWLGPRLGWSGLKRWLGYWFIGFSLFWSSMVFFSTWPQYARAKNPRNWLVVEGPVTNFRPMPYEGHRDECFTVKYQEFCYSDFDMGPGFNQSASHGGPIREGLPVRIWYIGGTIARLEVKADALPSHAQRQAKANAAENDWRQRLEGTPQIDRMTLGFMVAAVFITAWWTLQPRRFMRFYTDPDHRPALVPYFRVFFLLDLAGTIAYLVQDLVQRPRHFADYRVALGAAAGWILAMWLMVKTVEWYRGVSTRNGRSS